MSKKIVYVATDNGVDGREQTTVMYASFGEDERNSMLAADKSKAWRGKSERMIARKNALAKLDGIDRLVLGLPAWPASDLATADDDSRTR